MGARFTVAQLDPATVWEFEEGGEALYQLICADKQCVNANGGIHPEFF